MNKYEKFFEKWEKEIEFFQEKIPGIMDDIVYDNFYEMKDFINALLAFCGDNEECWIEEYSLVDGFISKFYWCNGSDNIMDLHLRMAYFHCIAAMVEWVDHLRDCERLEG